MEAFFEMNYEQYSYFQSSSDGATTLFSINDRVFFSEPVRVIKGGAGIGEINTMEA